MSAGYQAALEGVAVAARPDRARARVTGRDPVAMLQGILTNSVPAAPTPAGSPGVTRGRAAYSAILTPKGRMVADLRVVRGPRGDDQGLLLDLPTGALAGLLAHLGRYLPPRFAKTDDVSGALAQITVAGPGGAALLSRDALGLRVETAELDALGEGDWLWVDSGGEGVLIVRSADLDATAFDLFAERATADALARNAVAAGAAELNAAALEALRIEAGRPAWGADLDEETIPPEAGIDGRAIDHGKGCYTGQEVIVRLRDRGHVNRHLRALRFDGEAPLPERGAELWVEGKDRPVGSVTSAAASPRAGSVGLGWVRREVDVPAELRVGGPDGPRAQALAATTGWWRG